MTDYFKLLSQWLESTEGSLVLCGAIAAFGLAAYVFYFRPRAVQVLRSIASARNRLEEVENEEGFAARFEEFDREFREHPLLGHGWREFVDTLVEPKPSDRIQAYRSSRESAEYFGSADIVEGRLNLRFVQAVPGYLTGGGILGTFIGLVAGIYLASAGLASQDIQQTRAALTPLLSGAALAFWTSIVGLIGSILFSMAEKRLMHRIDQEVGGWNASLDRRLRRVTPEQLAAEQVHEAARQTLQLERFNTDLAVSIAQALENRLAQSFSPRIDQVITSLDQLRGHQAEFSRNVLEEVASRISQSVSGAAGVEMRQMAETMHSLVQILRESAGALKSGQAQTAQVVTDVIERLETMFSQSTATISTQTTKSIGRLVEYLDAAASATSSQLTSAGESVSVSLAQAAQQLTTALENASGNAAGQLDRASGNLVAGLQVASSHVSDNLKAASEQAASRFAGASDEAAKAFTAAGELVNSAAGRFSSTAMRLEELHTSHAAAIQTVQLLLRDLQDLHGSFALTVQPLAEGVRGLTAVNTSLSERVKESAAFQQALMKAAEDTRTAQASMQQAWTSYQGRFEQIDGSVERMFTEINQGLDSYSAMVRGFVGELDKSFAKALSELSSVVQELDQTVDDFSRAGGGARR